MADNPPLQIYVTKIKNRIVFKIKTGYKLELLFPETVRQLGSSKKDVDQVKDGEDIPKLESVEVLLVHCDLFSNNYQQASEALFTFVPNKHFGQIITIAPHSLKISNTTNTEFSLIEVWFTDQKSKQLETKDNANREQIIG